ncbi:hypothetical protein C7457_0045 [Thermovibrio guaymasensis]|uniref:Uncharacterized protein n=1 Tax=Thermovibrio guaymasensis TaxID=240167 RepID=A0A420W7B8_9BACT|nr:hypothetical protein [Thermovibrio guaymasensis]RKQ63182.1 hypothetical protein C7457_0045 [Thermovibrio guaymasensis]
MESKSKVERLARTVVADFFLYNPDKIDKGLMNDNFFELLKGELEDAVTYFRERSSGDMTIFWDTLFNRLMQREAKLLESK